jgi:hypothetical protein
MGQKFAILTNYFANFDKVLLVCFDLNVFNRFEIDC